MLWDIGCGIWIHQISKKKFLIISSIFLVIPCGIKNTCIVNEGMDYITDFISVFFQLLRAVSFFIHTIFFPSFLLLLETPYIWMRTFTMYVLYTYPHDHTLILQEFYIYCLYLLYPHLCCNEWIIYSNLPLCLFLDNLYKMMFTTATSFVFAMQ